MFAALAESGLRRLESRSHSLVMLAELGDWPRYQAVLRVAAAEALAAPAVAAGTAALFVAPANVWLSAGWPRRAAGALEVAIYAALVGYSHFGEDSPDRDQLITEVFVGVAMTLHAPDVPHRARLVCRNAVIRKFTRPGSEIGSSVDRWLADAEAAIVPNGPTETE